MRKHRLLSAFNNLLLASVLILSTDTASAVVNSTQSRLVFNEDSMAESLTLVNSIRSPALVQMWTDDNDPLSPPDRISTPLIVVPPLFKLAPAESRNLRVMLLSREGMPKDRERVYWLNIYQIPPNTQKETAQEKKVILPLRIRLKVFVRPIGLKEPEENNGEKLRFTLRQKDAQNSVLTVNNPTPYYMNLGTISLMDKNLKAEMIAPFSSTSIPATNVGTNPALSWTVIDDYGKQTLYNRELSSQ
ncbi:P pilus assembly protein, chaperone PapD [Candidatus Pantoea varia]|uniref:P pilus assembly protein, chaperone PapD n=1 Tax=Candidatus Pantoea varia TaxID=1881036 RepID=A0A1I5HUM3_9GAMM|nr:fimbria/pilus periplasmic chaperone [Pantoea varia]SFO52012.1 P pilus assembly protein, chaperone PapD [Pantoea varia]